jgi:hypothetical protein
MSCRRLKFSTKGPDIFQSAAMVREDLECAEAFTNMRQPELKLALLASMQAATRPSSGMKSLHRRIASPEQAAVSRDLRSSDKAVIGTIAMPKKKKRKNVT